MDNKVLAKEETRKTYEPPKLERLGTVNELTHDWDVTLP